MGPAKVRVKTDLGIKQGINMPTNLSIIYDKCRSLHFASILCDRLQMLGIYFCGYMRSQGIKLFKNFSFETVLI
jgi:hypothetical protein